MNKNKFIKELSEIIERYKLDKIVGVDKRKLALGIYGLLVDIYDLPKKKTV